MAINRTRANTEGTGLKVEVETPVVGAGAPAAKPAAKPAAAPRPPAPPAPRAPEASPRYLEMQRVDGRIRHDQAEELATLRRRLQRGRTDRSERITDNTLLRVAVDLLLAHADKLGGDTEDDLAAGVLTAEQMRARNGRMADNP